MTSRCGLCFGTTGQACSKPRSPKEAVVQWHLDRREVLRDAQPKHFSDRKLAAQGTVFLFDVSQISH